MNGTSVQRSAIRNGAVPKRPVVPPTNSRSTEHGATVRYLRRPLPYWGRRRMARILTGIQSTGIPHMGNVLGAIRPAIALGKDPKNESFLFIADFH